MNTNWQMAITNAIVIVCFGGQLKSNLINSLSLSYISGNKWFEFRFLFLTLVQLIKEIKDPSSTVDN